MRYLIQNENAPSLYWSNTWGWVCRESADQFSETERETLNLPIEGDWIIERQSANIEGTAQ